MSTQLTARPKCPECDREMVKERKMAATECPICGADVYAVVPSNPSWLWHLENEDCRAIRTPATRVAQDWGGRDILAPGD